ncbi:MAG: DNA binding protein VP5 [Microviridae sp.]
MKLTAYSIYDTKVEQWGLPFFCHHDELAKRICCEAVQDENTQLSRYPNDYILFSIGSYEDHDGLLTAHAPQNLGVLGAIYSATLAQQMRRSTSVQEGA